MRSTAASKGHSHLYPAYNVREAKKMLSRYGNLGC